MHDPESGDTSDEIIELTEGWSVCNDDIYSIANQLLSLAFAVKYFGDDSSRSRLLGVCESFYSELGALGEQVEPRPAFNYDRVYEWLRRTLEDRSAAPESEDVLVDEDKSTLYAICPISRRGISQPVSQKFSYGDDSCDHVFDQTSIKELIRASRCTSVSCPVAGKCIMLLVTAYLPLPFPIHVHHVVLFSGSMNSKWYGMTVMEARDVSLQSPSPIARSEVHAPS
ncbi:hypothetical protein, conserved [Babesia bigemina]|uniref:SP-RING-type domain-containing protein n=1 Tax=Babesia bigemina TaxID=5866 RepID=A0A061DCA6_BABBI|nr:hypothetical protein, conserved [Babesia bigemina]CDR95435.1 hypothetical protein, conserved [Babesia bigemina]|eukprot:XP_012767621.1 hypothetical protein, conserved [Babesia bigemina]